MTRHKPFASHAGFGVSAPALASAVLWGLVECLALWRLRLGARRRPHRS